MKNQELLKEFLEHLKLKNYSPASLDNYDYCLNKFFGYCVKPYKDITREDILEYGSYLKEKNYSPYTVERCLDRCH